MNSLWKAMVGQVVQVWTSGAILTSGSHSHYFGVLEACDEDALLLRQQNGETLFLPLSTIRRIETIDPDELSQENLLLRPTSAPDSETLVRPAADPSTSDPNRLLRTVDSVAKTAPNSKPSEPHTPDAP